MFATRLPLVCHPFATCEFTAKKCLAVNVHFPSLVVGRGEPREGEEGRRKREGRCRKLEKIWKTLEEAERGRVS